MGLLTAAGTAPYVGFALVAGTWVDRLPRRRPLLVAADLLDAALLTVPLSYALGALTVAQLVAVELAVGICRVVFRPGFQAHLPDVVRREELTASSGHLRAAESGALMSGAGLGGLLVHALSAPVAVVVDALSFVTSAVLISRVEALERVGHQPPPRRRLRVEVCDGITHMWQDRRLRAIAGAAANLNFFGLMVMALHVVYLTRELDFSPVMIAAVTVSGGMGALAGAVLAPRVTARVGRGRTLLLASVVFSVGMVAFLLTVVPRGMLGRVNSSLATITQGVKPLGAIVGGALAGAFGMRPALWVAAVGTTTTVLWVWFSPLRHDRER